MVEAMIKQMEVMPNLKAFNVPGKEKIVIKDIDSDVSLQIYKKN